MDKTCFVIMPIGNLKYGDIEVSSDELRDKYDNLISQAILNARPNLEVIRADDVIAPGTVTTDILMRLMHSDYVVADITYPNPNVFYELGIRHSCRSGTILIKEKNSVTIPFDISHLRYLEYENSIVGLKKLSSDIKKYFELFDKKPNYLDSQVLELANLTKYKFLKFDNEEEIIKNRNDSFASLIVKLLQNPKFISLLNNKSLAQDEKNARILKELSKSPETANEVIKFLMESGNLKI